MSADTESNVFPITLGLFRRKPRLSAVAVHLGKADTFLTAEVTNDPDGGARWRVRAGESVVTDTEDSPENARIQAAWLILKLIPGRTRSWRAA